MAGPVVKNEDGRSAIADNGGGGARKAPTIERATITTDAVEKCRGRLFGHLNTVLREVLDEAGKALLDKSNNESNAEVRAVLYDAMQALREQREAITSDFFDDVERQFRHRLNSAPDTMSSGALAEKKGGLSLVDEQELEEMLAVNGLAAKAEERFRNELYAIERRLGEVVRGNVFEQVNNPFAPTVICNAFRHAVHPREMNISARMMVYKTLDRVVMREFGDIYGDINGVFVQAGILPEIKMVVAKPAGSEGPGPHAAPERTAPRAKGAGAAESAMDIGMVDPLADTVAAAEPASVVSAEESAGVYNTLQRLLSIRKFGSAAPSPASAEGGVAAAVCSMEELISSLSSLQFSAPQEAGATSALATLKQSLMAQFADGDQGRRLDPSHDNTIDVIEMIFDFILEEPTIPDHIKGLLGQLRIPIVKVALIDKEFFSNKTHPARRLLNAMAHASIRWSDYSEAEQLRRQEKMQRVVQRVLDEFQSDPGLFQSLLDDFIAFLTVPREEDAGETGSVADDAAGMFDETEAAQEEEKPGETIPPARQSFELVEIKLEGRDIPGEVKELLRGTWRQVIQNTLETAGERSEEYRRRAQIVDDLLWSVVPKKKPEDKRRLMGMVPHLLDGMRAGMSFIGRGDEDIDAAFDMLAPIHFASMRGEKFGAPPPPPPAKPSSSAVMDMVRSIRQQVGGNTNPMVLDKLPPPPPETPPEPVEETGASRPALDEGADISWVREMKLGAWLEFDIRGKRRRAKLAWKSAVMGQYVFVDRRYKVVAEKTLEELANELYRGTTVVVENVPMFDRALDAVLNSLMNAVGATPAARH